MGADRLDLRLEARPENMSGVCRALEQMDLPEGLVDDTRLLATELVTNSIRHAGLRPNDLVHVTAHWSGATLRVNVQGGAGPPKACPIAGSIRPPPGAESGWGLYFVDQLASRWGTSLDGVPGCWSSSKRPQAPSEARPGSSS